MAIIKGQKTVGALYRGRTPVIKVYRGKVMVFPSSSPEPPVGTHNFQGKFRDDSTSDDWWYNPYSSGRTNIADKVDPVTKRFDFDISNDGNLYNFFYRNDYIEEVNAVPTAGVTNFRQMFGECKYLKKVDASDWDTSLSTNFNSMFYNCYLLEELDCSSWDVSKATDINYMFAHCQSLERLILGCQFHFDSVTPKSGMNILNDCPKLKYIRCTQKFRDWCIQYQDYILLPDAMREGGDGVWDVIDCSKILSGKFTDDSTAEDWWYRMLNKNISIADEVDPSTKTFSVPIEDTQDIPRQMFISNGKVEHIYTMPTEGWKSMYSSFFGCTSLKSVNTKDWVTSEVTDMQYTFANCKSLVTIDVSSFDTSSVTNMTYMFNGCESLESITGIKGWNVEGVTSFNQMFAGCKALKSLDLSGWEIARNASVTGMFEECSSLERLYLDKFTFGETNMFRACSNLKYIRCTVAFRDYCWINASSISLPDAMKDGGDGVWELIDGDDSNNYISGKLTDISGAWYRPNGSTSATKYFTEDVSDDLTFRTRFNVASNANVINNLFLGNTDIERIDHIPFKGIYRIESPFSGMSNLTYINLSGWDTSSTTWIHWLFYMNTTSSTKLETIEGISDWDVSNATYLNTCFYRCAKLVELDLSGWYTPKVENMNYFISGCSGLQRLYVDNLDVSSLQTANGFFEGCSSLNYIRCKTAFRDWAWANATAMQLPEAMKKDGSGIWDLVD